MVNQIDRLPKPDGEMLTEEEVPQEIIATFNQIINELPTLSDNDRGQLKLKPEQTKPKEEE
jgi:hypothetical protein